MTYPVRRQLSITLGFMSGSSRGRIPEEEDHDIVLANCSSKSSQKSTAAGGSGKAQWQPLLTEVSGAANGSPLSGTPCAGGIAFEPEGSVSPLSGIVSNAVAECYSKHPEIILPPESPFATYSAVYQSPSSSGLSTPVVHAVTPVTPPPVSASVEIEPITEPEPIIEPVIQKSPGQAQQPLPRPSTITVMQHTNMDDVGQQYSATGYLSRLGSMPSDSQRGTKPIGRSSINLASMMRAKKQRTNTPRHALQQQWISHPALLAGREASNVVGLFGLPGCVSSILTDQLVNAHLRSALGDGASLDSRAVDPDDLVCPVCLDDVPAVRADGCGHGMCVSCAKRVSESINWAAPLCPFCRAKLSGWQLRPEKFLRKAQQQQAGIST
eukprot:jgi/Chrzof1/9230/Cz03g40220.t1